MAAKPVPFEEVEKMFVAYSERPTAQHVVSKCGCSWHTAQKYILHGDPKRGIRPFKRRVKRVAKLVMQQTEEHVAYTKATALAASWAQLDEFDEIIHLAIEELHAKMIDDAGSPNFPKRSVLRIQDVAKSMAMATNVKRELARMEAVITKKLTKAEVKQEEINEHITKSLEEWDAEDFRAALAPATPKKLPAPEAPQTKEITEIIQAEARTESPLDASTPPVIEQPPHTNPPHKQVHTDNHQQAIPSLPQEHTIQDPQQTPTIPSPEPASISNALPSPASTDLAMPSQKHQPADPQAQAPPSPNKQAPARQDRKQEWQGKHEWFFDETRGSKRRQESIRSEGVGDNKICSTKPNQVEQESQCATPPPENWGFPTD